MATMIRHFCSDYCKYYKIRTVGCAKCPEAIIRLCIVLQNFDIIVFFCFLFLLQQNFQCAATYIHVFLSNLCLKFLARLD